MEWRGEGEAYRITQPSSTSPFLIEDSTYLLGERQSSLINYQIGGGVIFQMIITLLVIEIMVITPTLKYTYNWNCNDLIHIYLTFSCECDDHCERRKGDKSNLTLG